MARKVKGNSPVLAGIVILGFLIYAPYAIWQDIKDKKNEAIADVAPRTQIGPFFVPGTLEDAKTQGFTNCTDDGICSSAASVNFDGIIFERAKVTLNRDDNFKHSYYLSGKDSSRPLTYREIRLSGIPEGFREKLKEAGWQSVDVRKGGARFYKPGLPAVIRLESKYRDNVPDVVIEPAKLSEVENELNWQRSAEASKAKTLAEQGKTTSEIQSAMGAKPISEPDKSGR